MDLVKLILSPFHAPSHLLKIHGTPQLTLPEHLGCMRDVGDSNLTVAGGTGLEGDEAAKMCILLAMQQRHLFLV